MLEKILKSIKDLITKNVKIMTVLTVITVVFGAIQVYYAYIDHNKGKTENEIDMVKASINKNINIIDSIYNSQKGSKVEMDSILYYTYNFCCCYKYIEKHNATLKILRGKDDRVIKQGLEKYNYEISTDRDYMMYSYERIMSLLFDINVRNIKYLIEHRDEINTIYDQKMVDCYDAFKLKQNKTTEIFKRLNNKNHTIEDFLDCYDELYIDPDYYKFENTLLETVVYYMDK